MKAVVTLVGIFKQAIHWVEYFMRKKKEPFSVEEKVTTQTVKSNYNTTTTTIQAQGKSPTLTVKFIIITPQ